jgi:hypothetical protein
MPFAIGDLPSTPLLPTSQVISANDTAINQNSRSAGADLEEQLETSLHMTGGLFGSSPIAGFVV